VATLRPARPSKPQPRPTWISGELDEWRGKRGLREFTKGKKNHFCRSFNPRRTIKSQPIVAPFRIFESHRFGQTQWNRNQTINFIMNYELSFNFAWQTLDVHNNEQVENVWFNVEKKQPRCNWGSIVEKKIHHSCSTLANPCWSCSLNEWESSVFFTTSLWPLNFLLNSHTHALIHISCE